MGWLWLVGSIKLQVSFAREPYKRDDILQKRRIMFIDPTERSHPISPKRSSSAERGADLQISSCSAVLICRLVRVPPTTNLHTYILMWFGCDVNRHEPICRSVRVQRFFSFGNSLMIQENCLETKRNAMISQEIIECTEIARSLKSRNHNFPSSSTIA